MKWREDKSDWERLEDKAGIWSKKKQKEGNKTNQQTSERK